MDPQPQQQQGPATHPPTPPPPELSQPAVEPLRPQPSGSDGWLLRNTVALLVLMSGLSLNVVSAMLVQFYDRGTITRIQRMHEETAKEETPALTPENALRSPFVAALSALFIAGALTCIGAALAAAVWPAAREWLRRVLALRPSRPLPALRIVDLLACGAVFFGSLRLVYVLALPYLPSHSSARQAVGLLLQAAAMAVAVAAAIGLARHRAGAARGANGVWPFWKLSSQNQPRSVWYDIGLGLLCYPLLMWIVNLVALLNKMLAEHWGWEVRDNPIVGELLATPSAWVLVVLVIMATAGAAFFEELLFRGVLYNVMRRYLGEASSAILAAGVFAAAHMLVGQFLGLFVLGLILIWLYERTGRLIASMTFHALNNGMALVMVFTLNSSG